MKVGTAILAIGFFGVIFGSQMHSSEGSAAKTGTVVAKAAATGVAERPSNRLAEYRSVTAQLEAHQSAQCRKIVGGGTAYLLQNTPDVTKDSELIFNGIIQESNLSRCL